MSEHATTALEASGPVPRRKVWAWAMWDWGTQPLNTVIITFVFSVYLVGDRFGANGFPAVALAAATALGGVAVALVAPVLGQASDRSGHTVRNLRWQTWAIAILAGCLFFVAPAPAYLFLGLGILTAASVIGEIANVNYYALLDDVATKRDVGRVSGFGWGMGYLGGIVALMALYFGFIQPEVGLFGVTGENGMDIRVSMLFCAVWIAVFTIPTFVALRDKPKPAAEKVGVLEAYRMLFASLGRLWRTSRNTVYFLLASALFRDGLAGVFAFGGALAATTFGFSAGQVIIFGAVANVVAGVSTIAFGYLDDRIGPKWVIMISLIALCLLGLGVFAFHDGGQIVFWTLGLAMCAFVGPAQSASRSFLARLIPAGKSGEVFGLYATTGRAVSFLSPLLFGAAILVGGALTGARAEYFGILGIVIVLAAGLVLMLRVSDPAADETL